MKVLIDSCIAGSVATALAEAGHDVECVADWPADPGDAAVAQQAAAAVAVLSRYAEELIRGSIITAEPSRTRVRPRDPSSTTGP